MSKRLYGNAIGQINDRVKMASGLLVEAMRAMVDEDPATAKTCLEQAEMIISGAATLAKWSTTLLKEGRA